ncbi:zinc finger protein 804A-like [Salvelinus namaycush]|uniref:Zinc finger protein 804A-like n=1 Tax=Salvelinus namaycush TaxID=8040 RepID=A0A8U0U4N1_SALNM|nr:zinc finger protein 804A-like [Salvelinus namaycush]
MACYYIVISSTHLSNGHFRNIKGVFRGPLGKNGNKNLDYAEKERTTTMAKALEDPKANFYCDLCDKQYCKHQEFDNHINSYDHAHKQRLKELKQREFARNVASKTRKDERKQERALQRLHELAEQRREVQCAPGSGPKFKSTTVAVDASCRESCTDGLSEESHNSTVLETGTHNRTTGTSTGLASNSKTQQTLYWPYNGKAKKQTYKRHKIAFSFSFPKKASVKLESAAAVFYENTEEGSKERIGTQRRKLRIPLVELNIPVSTAAEEKGQGCAGVETNGTKPGDLSPNSFSDGSQRSSDTLSRSDIPMPPQVSHLYSVLVNSEDIARHYVSSVSQLPASPCHIPLDDPDTVLDTQNSEETQRNSPTEAEPETSKQQQVHKVERSVSGEENSSISSSFSEVIASSDGPPENGSSSSQSSECPGTAREKGEDITAVVKTLSCPFTKPSQPFFSVLSKDGYTVLQWPSEMLTFTRTEPCLSYSCNPLHFDFKASQQSQSRAKRFQIQNASLDKSCQHSLQSYPNHQRYHSPQSYPNQQSPCSPYHRPASPYHNHRPPSFHPQPPSDGMEKHHCVVQIQTHRHVLHHHQQQQVFPGKMNPVLPGSPVPMSPSCPPMLHPVHLSPMPNGSITIQHTILHHQHHQHHQHHHAYHHAAFLPPHPQPPLFPQVLPVPVSRRPMGVDICPPGPPPFLTSTPHLSVVATPSLHHHPMAVTFHAMPRPTMFPPSMLQSHPHPTVIPLQPMF